MITFAIVWLISYSLSIVWCVNITDIYTKEQMPLKQHFFGPNLHYHPSSGRLIIKCELLMKQLNSTNEKVVQWPPPKEIPSDLRDEFLLDGLVIPAYDYDKWRQNGNDEPYHWTLDKIKEYQDQPNTCGPFYRRPECDQAMTKYQHLIKGMNGLVIGTMDPWAEAWLIKMGAKHVTTLEYHRIISDHPDISSLHPSEVKDYYDKGNLFDFIFTYSSLEHNGLGKWGDPINPYGDLEDFARCHCLLKDGGHLFLGIPVGRDEVVWNAHRIYGRYRLSMVLKNWKLIDYIGPSPFDNLETPGRWEDQPIILLQKDSHTMEH